MLLPLEHINQNMFSRCCNVNPLLLQIKIHPRDQHAHVHNDQSTSDCLLYDSAPPWSRLPTVLIKQNIVLMN